MSYSESTKKKRKMVVWVGLTLFFTLLTMVGGMGCSAKSFDPGKDGKALFGSQSYVPKVHTIQVNYDGTFTPSKVNIVSGDTVEWRFFKSTDSVVPSKKHATYDIYVPKSYSPNNPFGFNGGPTFRKPSGVFALAPSKNGFQEVPSGSCSRNNTVASVGSVDLCRTGSYQKTMDSTYANSSITGVYIRLDWKRVQTGYSPQTDTYTYDWSGLDREISMAVRHGKLFSLSFRAGKKGTPEWLFTDGGVTELVFQDSDSHDSSSTCGSTMSLGNPATPLDSNGNPVTSPRYTSYQKHYFALLTAVSERIKQRANWYRALAYFKPSGANLFSHEHRLPKNCLVGCICNTQVWANAGYTPRGLYHFYQLQFELLRSLFPNKDFAYSLIQAGFPKVNNSGDYLQADGTSSGGRLPGGTKQTERVLELGKTLLGDLFTVSHLGLKPIPSVSCANENRHPAFEPHSAVGSGCPNKWVLEQGVDVANNTFGQNTGFQTNNANSGVATPLDLDRAFRNLFLNSDGVFLEIYEERLWEGERTHTGGILDPSASTPRNIRDWNQKLHERRVTNNPTLNDMRSRTYRFQFVLPPNSPAQTVHYMHGSASIKFPLVDGIKSREYSITVNPQP